MENVIIVMETIKKIISIIGVLFFLCCLARIFFRMEFSRPLVILFIIFFPLTLMYLAYAKWPLEENLRNAKSRMQEEQS